MPSDLAGILISQLSDLVQDDPTYDVYSKVGASIQQDRD